MAGHAQLQFVMTECSKTQIRLTRPTVKQLLQHRSVPLVALYIISVTFV